MIARPAARDPFRRPHTSRASSAARLQTSATRPQTSHIRREGSQEGLTAGDGERGGGRGGGREGGRGGGGGAPGLLSRSRTGTLSHSCLRPTPFMDFSHLATPEMGQSSKSGGASLPDYVEVQGHAGLWGIYIYICIYVCIYMYVCVYIYIYICIYVYMFLCMSLCMYICILYRPFSLGGGLREHIPSRTAHGQCWRRGSQHASKRARPLHLFVGGAAPDL